MDQHYGQGCFYVDVQGMVKRYADIEGIIKTWQRQRVFETHGIRKIVASLQIYLELD